MKFCIVGPAYPFRGGIAHHTTLLSRHLAERHDVETVSFKRLYPSFLFTGKSQLEPDASGEQVAIPLIDSINPVTWVSAGKHIRDLRPDWVIIQWWQPFFGPCLASIASRAKRQSKVAFICHNVVPHETLRFSREFTLRALKHGDVFIVHSEQDAGDLRSLLPEAGIRKTVHPQYELFPISGVSKEEARARLGIEGPMVLFFGLVREYKGLMDLIEAMSLIHRRDITCLAVGDFYDKKAVYESRIRDLALNGTFRLVDRYVPNEEVEPYFAAADVVVLPYRSATQSGIAQMAFRFGKPVISTTVGGLPEAVDDGRTGILVPPNNPAAIAGAIDRYYDDSMEARLTAGIRADKGRFSWDRVIETIEALGDQP